MWPCLVHAGDQQSNTIRPLRVYLCRCLRSVTDLLDDAFERDRATVSHLRGKGLALHEI